MAEAYDDILEPRKKYLNELERTHRDNVEQYFQELLQEAKIDGNANKKTCEQIYSLEAQLKKLKAKQSSSRALFAGAIILFVLLLFTGLIMAAIGGNSAPTNSLLVTFGLLISFGAIAFLVFAIVKKVRSGKAIAKAIENITKQIEELRQKAYGQMAALNNLYEYNIFNTLMNKTTPLIKMDRVFDMSKYTQLIEKFKWDDKDYKNVSTLYAQSGSILGNPFILWREYEQTMYNKTYTGSITITWTERVPSGDGKYTTRSRSQTLTASVSKPAPTYSTNTRLIFASEAAPKLSFTRDIHKHNYDEKSLAKYFKEAEKRVDNYAKEHPNFTPLGNDQFEDFFGGLDRDNEVEYRLLFTPLAQKSMLDLLTHDKPYGDDFSFYKNKMINTIRSDHSQTIDYDGYPSIFYHFDLEKAHENFVEKNMQYFQGLFFDLAPILAIPLYQQYPTNEYIFNKNKYNNFSRHVSETEANRYEEKYFRPADCVTPLILKSQFVNKDGNSDTVNITAHGFKGIEHVEYIRKMGGDGRSHDIPVRWIEYQPVQKVTPFVLQDVDLSRKEFQRLAATGDYQQFLNNNVANGAILCSKGLCSFINKSSNYRASILKDAVNKNLNK